VIMKRIFVATARRDYHTFGFPADERYMSPNELRGEYIGESNWRPQPPKIIERQHSGDFWNFHSIPLILSERAHELLGPQLVQFADILPLKYRKKDYFVVNCTATVDCLDVERTGWAEDDYVRINPFFHADRLTDALIFRIPQHPIRNYLSEELVNLIVDGDLRGLEFEEVWNESM